MTSLRSATIALGLALATTTAFAGAEPTPSLRGVESNVTTARTELSATEASDTIIISLCGVDLVGGDLWNARAPNPDTCIGYCTPESGCDAATWTNYEGGTCWLKRLGGSWANSKPSVGAASFLRTTTNVGSYMGPTFPANIDMPGNDIGNVQVASSTECRRRCVTNSYCFAYTWTNYNGGTCWLKSKASPFVTSTGAVGEYLSRVTNPDTCLANV